MSSEFESLRNKWFCNTCRIPFEKGRDAIQIHERSQKHKKNKERETKFQMRKMHNREKTEEEKYEQEVQFLNDRNQRRYTGAPPDPNTQNKPKGAGQTGGTVNRDSGYGAATGAGAGKPGFPGNKNKKEEVLDRELGISFKPQDMGVPGETWILIKDEDTEKLCFYNKISKIKHFERPRGVKLTPYEERKWEQYQANPEQNLDVLLDPKAASGQVGQWEEVAVEEDYYAQNAVDPRLEMGEEEEEQIDMKEVELEEKLDKLDELDEEQIEELLNLDKAEHGKSVLRSKTDKLKKLIDADVEAVFKPTFKKESDILFKRSTDTRGFDGDDAEKGKSKGNMFKKRKGGQSNASTGRVILGFEDDDEDKKSQ
jgi:hypothetical protein